MNQTILNCNESNYTKIDEYLNENNIKKLFIVCGKSFPNLSISSYINTLKDIEITYFNDFLPNPTYESVVSGVNKYLESKSNAILAIGGGSAIDVAKSIKAFANMNHAKNYLEQTVTPNDIKLIAMPTTAGTGSESTKFAVIYYQGEKQSVTHDSLIPTVVIFDPSSLVSLPAYQKKATVLDAFSHAIESYWSVNATDESKTYSLESLSLIIQNIDEYLNNNNDINSVMLSASNIAGKAINIAKTTAGHAMCYKLTSLYNIAHGHAAALINSELYPYMITNLKRVTDKKKREMLTITLTKLANQFGYDNLEDSKEFIRDLLAKLDLYNVFVNDDDIAVLKKSVNTLRLKNNPLALTEQDIENIYKNLFIEIEKRKKDASKTFN